MNQDFTAFEKANHDIKILRRTLRMLMLSMLAHPDCTEGSEFDDYTELAQEVLDKTKQL